MAKRNALAATLCCLALSPAMAADSPFVRAAGPVTWWCGTGSGGFEPGCSPDPERGTLEFIYRDDVVDSNPDADGGLFLNPLVSFRMVVEQSSRPDLVFSLSGPSQFQTYRPNVGDDMAVVLTVVARDESGALPDLRFFFPFMSRLLTTPNRLPTADERIFAMTIARGCTLDGSTIPGLDTKCVSETDWGGLTSVTSVPFATPVPEPETYAMWAVGMALLLWSKRHWGGGRVSPCR